MAGTQRALDHLRLLGLHLLILHLCRGPIVAQGDRTILAEAASPAELFMTSRIYEGPLTTTLDKVQVFEPGCEDQSTATSAQDASKYILRFYFDIISASFTSLARCPPKPETGLVTMEGGFQVKEKEYHQHDFVYIIPRQTDTPYEIAHILAIKNRQSKSGADELSLVMQRYVRATDVPQQNKSWNAQRDERLLHATERNFQLEIGRT